MRPWRFYGRKVIAEIDFALRHYNTGTLWALGWLLVAAIIGLYQAIALLLAIWVVNRLIDRVAVAFEKRMGISQESRPSAIDESASVRFAEPD